MLLPLLVLLGVTLLNGQISNDLLTSIVLSPTSYPYSISHLGCDFDDTITNDIWCFGGLNSSDIYKFDGNSFIIQSQLNDYIYGSSNHITIINGYVYLIDNINHLISKYNISNGYFISNYTNMPVLYSDVRMSSNNKNKLYLGGDIALKDSYSFNIHTKQWNYINKNQSEIHSLGGIIWYNDILILIGGNGLTSVNIKLERIDLINDNSFSSSVYSNSVPDNYQLFTWVLLENGILYTIGGKSGSTLLNTIYVYDINNDILITSSVTLTSSRSHLSCSLDDNYKLWCFCGSNNINPTAVVEESNEPLIKDFLTEMNQFSVMYPHKIQGLGCEYDDTITNKIWCFGGNNFTGDQSFVYSFDGISFTEEISLGNKFYEHGNNVAIIGGIVYIVETFRDFISTYSIIDGTYTEQFAAYPQPLDYIRMTSNGVDTLYLGCAFSVNVQYRFYIPTKGWTQVSGATSVDHGNGGIAYYNNRLVIFGGTFTISPTTSKLEFMLSPPFSSWTVSTYQSIIPFQLSEFPWYVTDNGILYILGGFSPEYPSSGDRIIVYDIDNNYGYVSNAVLFETVSHHSCCEDGYGIMWCFGGVNFAKSPSIVDTVQFSNGDLPTLMPTFQPSVVPTTQPSLIPSQHPTIIPSNNPSIAPTSNPSQLPTIQPTDLPSDHPTNNPTITPSTSIPTNMPTMQPSLNPSMSPSQNPTISPSDNPTQMPSMGGTRSPSTSTASMTGTITITLTGTPNVNMSDSQLEDIMKNSIIATSDVELDADLLEVQLVPIVSSDGNTLITYQVDYYGNIDEDTTTDDIINEDEILTQFENHNSEIFDSDSSSLSSAIELENEEKSNNSKKYFVGITMLLYICGGLILLLICACIIIAYLVCKNKESKFAKDKVNLTFDKSIEKVVSTSEIIASNNSLFEDNIPGESNLSNNNNNNNNLFKSNSQIQMISSQSNYIKKTNNIESNETRDESDHGEELFVNNNPINQNTPNTKTKHAKQKATPYVATIDLDL